MKKLEWWAREYIATLSVPDLVRNITDWANEYGNDVQKMQVKNPQYLAAMLGIERDNPKRIRKDFITWAQTLGEVAYFWDTLYTKNTEFEFNRDVLGAFLKTYNASDDKDTWWNKIVAVATAMAVKNGDVAMNLRVAITGRTNTPDLYSVMQVMGGDMVERRVKEIING